MLKLSKIELTGFKSFAGTETIDLERPVTSIVGPNGGGKSNILDAILFAFGEQSPLRLRTSRMDALIFGGAGDTRRVNFTSVKLTFVPQFQQTLRLRKHENLPGDSGLETPQGKGNGDGNGNGRPTVDGPVTLERRLYRDGVSEYVINGETARLRDIDDFFAHFGLGRASQIAITQGEVEKKILANQQEMRSWLVRACGIGLLIDKKKRTEDKLASTETNLERVGELILMTRKRVDVLSAEREDALEYRSLSKKLSSLKLENLRREIGDCFKALTDNQATLAEVRSRLQSCSTDAESAKTAMRDAESESEDAREAVEARMTDASDAQRKRDETASSVKALEVETRMLAERARALKNSKLELEESLTRDEKQKEAAEEAIEELQARLTKLEEAVASLKSRLDAAEAESSDARDAYERSVEAELDCDRLTRDLEHRLSVAENTLNRIDSSETRLRSDLDLGEKNLAEAGNRLVEMENERVKAFELAQVADRDTADALSRLQECKSNLETERATRDRLRDSYASVDARLSSLRALDKEAEGFAPGKKALLTDPELSDRVRGARDIWHGIEYAGDLNAAVYLVLSAFEDAVEVGNLDEGCKVLAEFQKDGIGKARILSADGSSAIPERPDWWPDGVTRFFETVTGGGGRLGRMFCEIGEVAIVDSLDDAKAVLEEYSGIAWAVLRDGTVMLGRGQAVGGAPSSGSLVLSRRSTIGELASDAARLNVELAAAESGLKNAAGAVKTAQAELDKLSEEKAKQAKDLAVLDERVSALNARIKEIGITNDAIKIEASELEKERGLVADELGIRKTELARARAKLAELEELSKGASGKLAECEAALSDIRSEHSRESEEHRIARVNLAHLESQAADLAGRIENAAHRNRSIADEILVLEKKKQDAEENLADAGERLETEAIELEEKRALLEAARTHAVKMKTRLEEMRISARDASENAARFERDLAKFDVARGRLLYRYHDLWKGWYESTRIPETEKSGQKTEESRISPETLAIAEEALTLSRAFWETEGIILDSPEDENERTITSTGESEAASHAVETAEDNVNDEKADSDSPSEQSDEQMELESAAEIMISRWEENGLPEPPAPPSALESIEKISRAALRRAIAEAEVAQHELGEVNLKAPAQWEEESTRLRFFLLQEADIRTALEQLTDMLKKLNRDTLARYRARAEKISARFMEYFLFLFGSGSVSIEFTEPDDILSSGVEIYVTLPGERNQPLRSLSGGERSLIFLALFLASHSVGENGFCIMDEADASLDDANILRLGRLIDAMTSRTQFILVTHNKRTMELADGLIGVVSRPRGVSRVIPVDLARAKKYAEAGVK